MTQKQVNHVKQLKACFAAQVTVKYKKGAKEHGGDLFNYSELVLLDCAIDENIDQYVYLMTLREKLRKQLYKR